MSRSLAVLVGQERLYERPGHARPYGPPAETDDVHVIVLDSLPRGKVVMDQRGTDTRNLVSADRGAHTAATDGHAARDRARRHRFGERDDEVWIVIVRAQLVGPEIDDVLPGGAELRDQIRFQAKAPVIGGDSHTHGV